MCNNKRKHSSFKIDLKISWPSGNAFVSGAGGLGLKSRAGQIKTVLIAARHLCDISSKRAGLPGRSDKEMGPANSLHALGYYSEYNERFNLTMDMLQQIQKSISL